MSDPMQTKSGLSSHGTPVLYHTPIDSVPVYTIQNEQGFFPTGSSQESLISNLNVKLYQMHPNCSSTSLPNNLESSESILAEGILKLSDPAPGIPSEVVLIGECDGILFYIMKDDVVLKLSSRIYTLLLPEDCISISLPEDASDEAVLYMEGIFAARAKFVDKSDQISADTEGNTLQEDNEDLVPDDKISKSMYKFSLIMAKQIDKASQAGANYITKYGEQKRSNVTESTEMKVSSTSLYATRILKKAGKITHKTVDKVGNSVTNTIGGKMAKFLVIKESDGKIKRINKRFWMTSGLVFSNISNSAAEGYLLLLSATRDEAVEYVTAKYGHDASELARQTFGATIHFGKAALSARRILNVKEIMKESAKIALKGEKKDL